MIFMREKMCKQFVKEIITNDVPYSQCSNDFQFLFEVMMNKQSPTKPFLNNATRRIEQMWETYLSQPISERGPRSQLMEEVNALLAREEAEMELWKLWEECWSRDAKVRPSMRSVVLRMATIVAMDPSF